MRGLILIALALLISVGDLEAQKKKAKTAALNKKVIEPGDTWHCLTYSFGLDYASDCVRDEDSCDTVAAAMRAENPYAKVHRCFEKKKAAVFTFYSVLDEEVHFRALPSFVDCKTTRRILIRGAAEDVRSVSACHAIGKVKPPPEPEDPDETEVRNDKGRSCVTHGATPEKTCFKTYDSCQEFEDKTRDTGAAIVEPCTYYE